MKILDGKKLKEQILAEEKEKVKDLNLSLAVIQIGDNEASKVYIKQKEKMCLELNIEFKKYHFPEDTKQSKIEDLIDKLNNDDTTGILLQLPIPQNFDKNKLINKINYKKDIDGLTDINVLNLIKNKKGIIPCTPNGILEMLNRYNIDVKGKHVVIVGRSSLVGKPLADLLLNQNATITIAHKQTKDLKKITRQADILISATGECGLIKKDMIKSGTIVIDVGITRVNGKLKGDVSFDNVSKKASYITPVPGGVGPMTISCLAKNIYEAYLLQK